MSDLKLVAHQATPLERLLLDAAANESPSVEQRMRVRQALGLAAVSLMPPPPPPTGGGLTLGKGAIGLAVAGSAVAVALLFAVTHRHRAPPSSLVASAPPSSLVASAPLVANVPRAAELKAASTPEPVASPLPAQEVTSDAPAANAPRSVAKLTPRAHNASDDLTEQLRLIDAARTALAAGNAGTAAQALATYNSKFPRGSFGQEAAVLRIEAIDRQGNHTQAAALARSFLAAHPNSPHVSLVKRIAGS
ncbi:MAG: outer membrane protein assembly factor BamD [Polyangiaceae bacterium]